MTSSLTLRDLAVVREGPAVSIVGAIDRADPLGVADPGAITALRTQARDALEQIRSGYGDDTAEQVGRHIDKAIAGIDLVHAPGAVVIYADAERHMVVPQRAAQEPRVRVGERFALLEGLAAQRDHGKVLVLVVSVDGARLLAGDMTQLSDVTLGEFPMAAPAAPAPNAPHRDLPVHEHSADEHTRALMRAASHALAHLHTAEPVGALILVGAERDLAIFDAVAPKSLPVAGRVHGSHLGLGVAALCELVAPAVHAALDQRDRDRVAQAGEELTRSATSDLATAAEAARAGRARSLLVERRDTFADEVVERAVDEIVADVLAHGGDVHVVNPGILAAATPLILRLRY